jgi:hypothetical protein
MISNLEGEANGAMASSLMMESGQTVPGENMQEGVHSTKGHLLMLTGSKVNVDVERHIAQNQ